MSCHLIIFNNTHEEYTGNANFPSLTQTQGSHSFLPSSSGTLTLGTADCSQMPRTAPVHLDLCLSLRRAALVWPLTRRLERENDLNAQSLLPTIAVRQLLGVKHFHNLTKHCRALQ